jgi:hypothetical protein
MLSVSEQESFMHLIFDVIHNGVGMTSLEWSLKSMKNRFGNISTILNTRMKNERYSDTYDLPIMKVIFETQNHILRVSQEDFTKRKIEAINLLMSYGASLDVLNEKYMDHEINWDFYVEFGQISNEIYDMIRKNSKIITI